MQWNKWAGLLLFCLYTNTTEAQVAGGQRSMEFLRLSNAPRISALGGINVAHSDNDISFALQNPSLMRPALHNQLGLNYNAYYAGISIANLQYGYHVQKVNTSFVLGVQYLNYGSMEQTDATGNMYGSFKATDYALSLGASRQYGKNWRYGASLKFAQSAYYDKSQIAALADVGVNYYDTGNLWHVGIVAKNMGFVANRFTRENPAEPLPFDLQIGISKQLKHIPLRLMATVHHLYEWDIRYDNPADAEISTLFNTNDSTTKEKKYFADKLFRHFIFGAELTFAKRVTLSVGYNHLHRGELAIKDKMGMAGFSLGVGVDLKRFRVQYGRSYYHIAGAYNEFGINMALNKLINVGNKFNDKVKWDATYPDFGED
jgi:hypothetical protein